MTQLNSLAEFTKRCTRCHESRYVVETEGDLAVARVCKDCFEVCPACDDEEYQFARNDRGYTYAERCPVCGTLHDRVEAFNEASIPAKYHSLDSTLQAFQTYEDPERQRGEIGNLQMVKTRLYRWVSGYTPGERGFLLHGKVGTGKTHLIAAIVRHLTLEKGIQSKFVEFTHLLSDIREQFDQGRGDSVILGPIVGYPVLAIDELGKGRKTDWQLSIIDEIISKRYNRGLTTLFTTNYPVDVPRTSDDATADQFRRNATAETLRERVGERIFSRLHEMADFVELKAPDFRRHAVSG